MDLGLCNLTKLYFWLENFLCGAMFVFAKLDGRFNLMSLHSLVFEKYSKCMNLVIYTNFSFYTVIIPNVNSGCSKFMYGSLKSSSVSS